MAYKTYPWYCWICHKWVKGEIGKASHRRGTKHQKALKKHQITKLTDY